MAGGVRGHRGGGLLSLDRRPPSADALVVTRGALIGVESKRYEPFRDTKRAAFSDACWRDVCDARMRGYESVRDRLRENPTAYRFLDAAQLVKHAVGLRTEAGRRGAAAILCYLYAEPETWADGWVVDRSAVAAHRDEAARFAARVARDEVVFVTRSWRGVLDRWRESPDPSIRAHAEAVAERLAP